MKQKLAQGKARSINNSAWVKHESMAHRFSEGETLGRHAAMSWWTAPDDIHKSYRFNSINSGTFLC